LENDIRKEAIQRHILGGESPKTIYKSLNRSKKWFFKWLKRYESGEPEWFKDHSRAPITRPAETKPRLKEHIISTRRHLEDEPYAQIGVSAVKWELKKLRLPFPSDSTINRILKREGLVKKNSLCPQGHRVSLFYRGPDLQQYSPDGYGGTALHQRGRKVLLAERH